MTKRKLLIVYTKSTLELINRQSALGSYIFCLAEIIQKSNFLVFVNGISFEELKIQSSNRNENPANRKSYLFKFIPVFIKEFVKDILIFKKIINLSKVINNSGKYDCVLEFYNYASNVGLSISKTQKIPLVMVYDAPVLEEHVFFHGPKLFFKKSILLREKQSLIHANHLIVYSDSVKRYITNLVGNELHFSIHQNVDFTRFHFLEKKFSNTPIKIGFIGSFLKWHRIDLLISAFQKLRVDNYEVELLLVGNGMEYNNISQMVEKSMVEKFIKMPGFLDGEELLNVKQQIQIGVMPGSNWYGAPNKIFEYGAAKIAVVAPDTPTIKDLFEDNKELLLFKQDDENELFLKLKILCDDIFLREKLASSLQEMIRKKYSEKNTAEFYKEVLNSVTPH